MHSRTSALVGDAEAEHLGGGSLDTGMPRNGSIHLLLFWGQDASHQSQVVLLDGLVPASSNLPALRHHVDAVHDVPELRPRRLPGPDT